MNRGTYLGLTISFVVLAALVAFIAGSAGWTAMAENNEAERRLSVDGYAEIEVAPDIAKISLGVESEAASASLAQQKNAKAMAAVVDALQKSGVAREDIQTSGYNLFPVRTYDSASNREKLVGYRASNLLHITTRNLEGVGKLIDEAVRAGATNVGEISFSLADESAWENEAATKAIAVAQSKAKAMARAAGVSLGRPLMISHNSMRFDFMPVASMGQMKAVSLASPSRTDVPTPVEPGKITVRASVQMLFEI